MDLLKYRITIVIELRAFLSFSVCSTAHHSTLRIFTTGYCANCHYTVCRNIGPIIVSVQKEEFRKLYHCILMFF